MNMINNVISGYQQRIGKYDKQVWEQTIEQEVLKRLRSVPRKTAKVNPDLIDVDLFRGSAFSASKPNHGWVAITRMALMRTLFLPLYFRWWKCCIGLWLISLLCLLYVFQIIALFIFLGNPGEDRSVASLSSAHVFCPCVMMFILALIHTQMMSAAEFSPQYTRVRPSSKRESSKKHSKVSSSRPAAEQERDSGGSRDTGIDLNLEDVRVRSGARRPPEARKASPSVGVRAVDKANEDRNAVIASVSSTDLTSDVASAFEKTSDWVRSLSPEQCELLQTVDAFEHLSAVPASSADDSQLNLGGCVRTSRNQSSASLNLSVKENDDEFCEKRDSPAGRENLNLEFCGSRIHDECHVQSSFCPTKSSLNHPIEDESVHDSSMQRICQESGKITETESVANSNGSLSDVADSSLISSPTDVNWENEDGATRNVFPPKDEERVIENVGLRCRKQGCFSDAPEDQSQINRGHPTNAKMSSRSFHPPFSTGWSGGSVSKDFVPTEKSPSRRSRLFVSSEEELEKSVSFSSFRPSCSRKSGVSQSTKALDKPFVRNIPETSKIGSRTESRSQPKVKVIDTRQMESTGISSCESDCEDRVIKGKTSPKSIPVEWEDINNTNTEFTSPTDTSSAGSSASDLSAKDIMGNMGETSQGIQHASSVMNNLASNTDRVSCMMWEPNSVHKVDMTVMDIGWMIIQRVDKMNDTLDYLILGFIFSLLLMFTPVIYRGYHSRDQLENLNYLEIDDLLAVARIGFGHHWRQTVVIVNGVIQRLCLSLMFFFLLSVAERTFKQRLLYAKNFCYLTSSRRAKKYELPHFRLNKVRNIKTWLSLRCFLKKRGPQRTVDSIVSAAFLLSVILLSILCIELLQGYGNFLDHLSNWELVIWCMSIGIYLLRFITLGTKINKKYRNFSVLITEQINLYLHMEQKPHKKDELMVANSVLKLAEDLLKELESPFKISGLSANPFLYNITKVVVLSAFSAVLTELLGFKLKLYKIKIRS